MAYMEIRFIPSTVRQVGCLAILLMAAQFCFAQTAGTAKLYGYKQPVTQGASPQKGIDEQGKETATEMKQRFNYLIYLASNSIIYPSEVWINGKAYSATFTPVTSTPVKHEVMAPGDTVTVLVPKTTQRVIRIQLAPAIQNKLTEKGKILSGKNELVVIYKSAGKFYYRTIAKMNTVEAIPMQ